MASLETKKNYGHKRSHRRNQKKLIAHFYEGGNGVPTSQAIPVPISFPIPFHTFPHSTMSAAAAVKPMSDLKKHFLEAEMPRIFTNGPAAGINYKVLGITILAKLIPEMDKNNEVAFAYHYAMKDLCAYSAADYNSETSNYKKTHKMKCDKGDTVWFYEFKNKDGKKRRCILETEIWYKPNAEHSVSPIAILFSQFFANGLHITKCRFEDAA